MWLGLSFSTCSTYDKKYKSFYRVNFLWMKTRSSFPKIISYFFILQWCDKQILVADVFLKIFRIFIKFCRWHCRPCQTSMMMFFVCVNYFQRELCIDVWLGSKYASTLPSIINIFLSQLLHENWQGRKFKAMQSSLKSTTLLSVFIQLFAIPSYVV